MFTQKAMKQTYRTEFNLNNFSNTAEEFLLISFIEY